MDVIETYNLIVYGERTNRPINDLVDPDLETDRPEVKEALANIRKCDS